jgi:hypothetical protein
MVQRGQVTWAFYIPDGLNGTASICLKANSRVHAIQNQWAKAGSASHAKHLRRIRRAGLDVGKVYGFEFSQGCKDIPEIPHFVEYIPIRVKSQQSRVFILLQ